MTAYFLVKCLHILSSTLLFGTGLGIAFFMWMAHLRGDAKHIAATARVVVIADGCFTAPAVVVQFFSGWWLARFLGIPLAYFWLRHALVLFVFVGCCWLPVLRLQVRARDLARAAAERNESLPKDYFTAMRWWFWLGWPAFIGVVGIFWLMVSKPGG